MATEPMESAETEGGQRIAESVRTVIQGLYDSASVDRVYGDPITVEGKTVVPVARVVYGFGGGFGSGSDGDETGESGEGGGGGGGVLTQPIGVVEVTADRTRFVRFTNWKHLALVASLGVTFGILLGRRRNR